MPEPFYTWLAVCALGGWAIGRRNDCEMLGAALGIPAGMMGYFAIHVLVAAMV